ncbi:hypothetical protein DLAC_03658 [Tieghemostelium lacteum]|uniref:Transmembrane protein n=1 Tax=Tieghemostelium lacteum TaxID=361077 RepID=A0A152A0I0_TIELA|nr:hypothetical protein DLAC_03658 [Tieghemostelium lacteum]|eukprot:KYQ99719.1 hypothetical protein DLAC_03658 [Tieghemostelium lacteum]
MKFTILLLILVGISIQLSNSLELFFYLYTEKDCNGDVEGIVSSTDCAIYYPVKYGSKYRVYYAHDNPFCQISSGPVGEILMKLKDRHCKNMELNEYPGFQSLRIIIHSDSDNYTFIRPDYCVYQMQTFSNCTQAQVTNIKSGTCLKHSVSNYTLVRCSENSQSTTISSCTDEDCSNCIQPRVIPFSDTCGFGVVAASPSNILKPFYIFIIILVIILTMVINI